MSKRIKAFILALMVLMTFSVPSVATTNNLATIDKTITEYDVQYGLYDVTLSVTGSNKTEPKPVDIVLVIDASISMNDRTTQGTKLSDAKAAAKQFVDIVFANGNPNGNRIAVVKFNSSANEIGSPVLSDNITTVKDRINSISTSSYTNIKAGFVKAKDILDEHGSTTRDAIVVLLSDGEANQGGSGPISHAQAAINAGRDLIGTARVYTIGLSVTGTTAVNTLTNATMSSGGTTNGGYYSAPSASNLNAIYQSIGNNINPAVLSAVVTDTVASNFEIVSIETPVPNLGTVTTTSALDIKWEIGDLGNTNVKLTYRIKLKDDWVDSTPDNKLIEANDIATLSYEGGSQTFPVPGVQYHTLTDNVNPAGAGNTTVKLNGTATAKRQFAHGVKVSVAQEANDGYTFVNWTDGDALNETQNTINITMDKDKTVTANYQQEEETEPEPKPTAVDDAYTTEEDVPLVISSPGILANDNMSGLTLTNITITEDITEDKGTLELGSELGSFTYTPAAGFTGTAVFKYKLWAGEIASDDATVTITVTPKEIVIEPNPSIDIESTIKGQSSGATATNGETITSYLMVVTNNGNQDLYDVEITNDGNGISYFIGNLPAGASVPQTANSFTVSGEGTTISLTATVVGYLTPESTTPQAYEYVSAEGPDAVQQAPIDNEREFVTDSDTTNVTIPSTYIPPYTPPETPVVETVTLTTGVSGQGTVLPGPGTSTYGKGTTVQLNPTPATGWQFSGWQGDAVDASNQIYMDSNKSVTAVFTEIPVIIQEEPAAAAPAVEEPVSEPQIEEIVEEEAPAAPAELPKTGGLPAGLFYGLGGLVAAAGIMLKKKSNR